MGPSPWAALRVASRAALALLLIAPHEHQPQQVQLQLPRVLLALGTGASPPGTGNGDGYGGNNTSDGASSLKSPRRDGGPARGEKPEDTSGVGPLHLHSQRGGLNQGEQASKSHGKHPLTLLPEPGTAISQSASSSPPSTAEAAAAAAPAEREGPVAPASFGEDRRVVDPAEARGDRIPLDESERFDVQTARRLVTAIEEAAAVASGAVATVEAVLKDVLVYKQECEARSRAVGEEMSEPRYPKP